MRSPSPGAYLLGTPQAPISLKNQMGLFASALTLLPLRADKGTAGIYRCVDNAVRSFASQFRNGAGAGPRHYPGRGIPVRGSGILADEADSAQEPWRWGLSSAGRRENG